MPIVVGTITDEGPEERPDPEHMGVFSWKIERYSTYENKRVIHSPTFQKGGFSWRLWLFPKGSVNATEGDMSIFLHYIKKDDVFSFRPIDHPRAKFSIKINNQLFGEDILHEIYDFHSFAESNGEWGWKDFAEIDRLFEDDSGLILDDALKVELRLFVQPKGKPLWPVDDAEESKTIVIRVLSDPQIRKEVGVIYFDGLPIFKEASSYCFYERMLYKNLEKLICKDLAKDSELLRFWLCEQLMHGNIRMVKNLSTEKTKLQTIDDLLQLQSDFLPSITRPEGFESVNIYIEAADSHEDGLKELNGDEDFLAFCKLYDPWNVQMRYLGTIPLRKGCTPAEVIVDARMLAGLNSNTEVAVYIEAPPSRDPLHELRLDDNLNEVGVRPGCTLIVQQKVDLAYATGKEMTHPTVLSFLQEKNRNGAQRMDITHPTTFSRTEPHDDVCVICFVRPRTVGFLHGESLHRCVCQQCAPHVVKDDKGTCPMCRKKIDKVILNIF